MSSFFFATRSMYQKLWSSSLMAVWCISWSTCMGYNAESSSINAMISFWFLRRQTSMKRKFTRATEAIAVNFCDDTQQLEPKWSAPDEQRGQHVRRRVCHIITVREIVDDGQNLRQRLLGLRVL